jgi:hypothetical protein
MEEHGVKKNEESSSEEEIKINRTNYFGDGEQAKFTCDC